MNTKEPILSFNDMRNIYPVSKTIAFRLIPDSRTQAYVEKNDIISNAETLSRDRNTLKNAADRIHRRFIEETLSKLRLPYGMLQEYSDATEETDREKRTARLSELNAALKKHIATAFKDVKNGGKTGFLAALGGEELLKDLLPAEVNTDEEREALKRLQRYTAYLRPYMDARARIYSEDGGGNTIPNRIVDDNLQTVLDNVKTFKLMPQDIRDGAKAIFDAVNPAWAQSIDEVFMLSYGCLLNAQSAIDAYNTLIGGISAEDGSRIQGLNELVNLHNQQLPRDGQDKRLPKFRQLKKQILSEHETLSWVPQALQSDAEALQVLNAIHEAYKGFNADSLLAVGEADPQRTYVRADRLAAFSKATFLDWRKATDCIKSALRAQNPRKARESRRRVRETHREALKGPRILLPAGAPQRGTCQASHGKPHGPPLPHNGTPLLRRGELLPDARQDRRYGRRRTAPPAEGRQGQRPHGHPPVARRAHRTVQHRRVV